MTIAHQIGEASRSLSLDNAATDFVRYVKVQAEKNRMARGGYREIDPLQLATAKGASSRLQAMLRKEMDVEIAKAANRTVQNNRVELQQRSSVAVGSIDGWGAQLAPFEQAGTAFLASLSPYSAFDRLWNDGALTRLPMRSRIAIRTDAAIGSVTDEGLPKAVLQMAFSQGQMPVLKAIGQVVLTDELILLTNSNRAFESELQKAVAVATDVQFLATITQDTNVASNPSTGLGAAAFQADVLLALQSIEPTGATSRLYLILPVSVFNKVSLLRDGGPLLVNGMYGNIRVIPTSAQIADGVLLDAGAGAVGGATDLITTRVSDQTSIVMQDNPTAGSHAYISMFQNDMSVILCERFFSASVLRPEYVSIITGMGST